VEEERRTRRRDADDSLVTTLRAIVHEEVKARTNAWPKKNGDGLLGYIGRLVTPERILLVIVLIYNVGGRVQEFQTNMRGVLERETMLGAKIEAVSQQLARLDTLTVNQEEAKGTALKQDAAIEELQRRSRLADQRLQLTITRQEFREAVEQRIVPRLERIEAQGR
jgi:hypothetical protein